MVDATDVCSPPSVQTPYNGDVPERTVAGQRFLKYGGARFQELFIGPGSGEYCFADVPFQGKPGVVLPGRVARE